MTSSIDFKEYLGKRDAVVMLNAMQYHSTIEKEVRMRTIPRKDVGRGSEALVPITFFDLEGAIEYYKERMTNERYAHLIKTSKKYVKTLSEFREWLKDK